jgi:glutathione S-transferase
MASSSMTPILTVFKWSPDGGKGMARDMRVRWALEEIGQPYEVRLVTFRQLKEPAHRARNPFGQIPAFEDDGLVLFESGAIIHYLAQTHPGLLPDRPDARARAVAWMFAAVSTVEPRAWPFSTSASASVSASYRPIWATGTGSTARSALATS